MNKVREFLHESNKIEREYSVQALLDAMEAWDYAKSIKNMTVDDVLEIHRLLLQNMNSDIAGKIRNCPIWIGKMVKDQSEQEIRNDLKAWLQFLFDSQQTEEDIKRAHIEFEDIHPFEDGNGRVGRILMNLQRRNAGLAILIIHEGPEQLEYYKWFQ